MTTAFATTAGDATSDHTVPGIIARITAAVVAAMARAKARQACGRLLACDEILRDVGVSRDDVRRALMQDGGL